MPEQRPHDEPEAVRGVHCLPPDGRRGEAVRLQHRDRDADRTPRPARPDGMEGAMKCEKCELAYHWRSHSHAIAEEMREVLGPDPEAWS